MVEGRLITTVMLVAQSAIALGAGLLFLFTDYIAAPVLLMLTSVILSVFVYRKSISRKPGFSLLSSLTRGYLGLLASQLVVFGWQYSQGTLRPENALQWLGPDLFGAGVLAVLYMGSHFLRRG